MIHRLMTKTIDTSLPMMDDYSRFLREVAIPNHTQEVILETPKELGHNVPRNLLAPI
jgi:hypothetical protein